MLASETVLMPAAAVALWLVLHFCVFFIDLLLMLLIIFYICIDQLNVDQLLSVSVYIVFLSSANRLLINFLMITLL